MSIKKYFNGKWYVRIKGDLVAGFTEEKYADLFIAAFKK